MDGVEGHPASGSQCGCFDLLWDSSFPGYGKNKRIWSPEASWSPAGLLSGQLLCSFLAGRISGGCLGRSFRALFCAVCWRQPGLWLILPGERLPKPRDFMNYSFFLYSTHFALVRLINKTAARLWNPVKWEPFALFLVMPVLVLAISYLVGKWLRRYLPSCWKLLNGFR